MYQIYVRTANQKFRKVTKDFRGPRNLIWNPTELRRKFKQDYWNFRVLVCKARDFCSFLKSGFVDVHILLCVQILFFFLFLVTMLISITLHLYFLNIFSEFVTDFVVVSWNVKRKRENKKFKQLVCFYWDHKTDFLWDLNMTFLLWLVLYIIYK